MAAKTFKVSMGAVTLQDAASIATIVAGAASVFALLQIYLIRRQLESSERARHEANLNERERRTLDACKSFHTDPTLFEIKQRIHRARADQNAPPKILAIRRDVLNYLNFIESICIGIEQNVYDEDIVYDNLATPILKAGEYFFERHPACNPNGDLVDPSEYAPFLRIRDAFARRKLGLTALPTYRARKGKQNGAQSSRT